MMQRNKTLPLQRLNVILITVSLLAQYAHASHFRGGTMSWKSEGGLKVRFFYRLGWKYGKGPGCTPAKLGQLLSDGFNRFNCLTGCGTSPTYVHGTNYYCTGASVAEQWEQGQNDFTYTFSDVGPFTVGFASGHWIQLSNGKGNGYWNLHTTVDLRKRSDTGEINISPQSMSKPIYHVPFSCQTVIKIPIVDADNDRIKCRWAVGDECASVCDALPAARLDEDKCIISFNTTLSNKYIPMGVYAVALTIEDFPQSSMTMGNITKTPMDAISAIPLQFLVQTLPQNYSCDSAIPRFVPPTPEVNKVIMVQSGSTAIIGLFADNGENDTTAKANIISASGPIGLQTTSVVKDLYRKNTFWTNATWSTSSKDLGTHIMCANVENDEGISGSQICFNIRVVEKGCIPLLCLNDGKCLANNGSYTCVCRPGFHGVNCEINIDECVSNPCLSNQLCVDGVNSFVCVDTTTPTTTIIKSISLPANTDPNSIVTTTTTVSFATNPAASITPTGSASSLTAKFLAKSTPYVTPKKAPASKMTTVSVTTPAHSKNCRPQYDECKCSIKKLRKRNANQQSTGRAVMMVSIGSPLGFLLSVFSCYLWREVKKALIERNESRKASEPRPVSKIK